MREYTTEKTSAQLIAASNVSTPQTIADFCAGGGSLLEAAALRWPKANLFANDIDRSVQRRPTGARWIFSDFLREEFDHAAEEVFPSRFDLVLLNPPFSSEREHRCEARGPFNHIRCSAAFAFLLTALQYVKPAGELMAIMPTSTLSSERDAEARSLLRTRFRCNIVSEPAYDRFPGLDVSTYLLSVRPLSTRNTIPPKPSISSSKPRDWAVSRGTVSVKRAERVVATGIHGWIHTTSIRSSKVSLRYQLPPMLKFESLKVFPKNSLVFPRVGRVQPGNVAIIRRNEILSDCLIAVSFHDPGMPNLILRNIMNDFNSFMKIFSGTGAPYTTYRKVSDYVNHIIDGNNEAREMELDDDFYIFQQQTG